MYTSSSKPWTLHPTQVTGLKILNPAHVASLKRNMQKIIEFGGETPESQNLNYTQVTSLETDMQKFQTLLNADRAFDPDEVTTAQGPTDNHAKVNYWIVAQETRQKAAIVSHPCPNMRGSICHVVC